MTGLKVSRIGPGAALPLAQSVTGTVSGDDVDWETPPPGGEDTGDTSGIFGATFDGGLSFLVAPHSQDIVMPYAGTITGWTVIAQESGSIQFDVLKCAYAGFAAFSSVVGTTPPTLSSAIKNTGADMTGWTTGFSAGDIFRVTMSSVSSIYSATVALTYSRP
jgi:hypothetical protein